MKNAIRNSGVKIMAAIAAVALAAYAYGAPPANDNFANATPISGVEGSITGTTIGATLEPGESGGEMDVMPVKSVWYKWTAPAGVTKVAFYFTSFIGYFEPALAIAAGNTLAQLDYEVTDSDSQNVFVLDNYYVYYFAKADVTPGQTYHIVVASIGDGFDFRLGWKAANGFSLVVDDGILLGCTGECPETLYIPNTVTWIAESTFKYCEKLESVTFSESVTGIGSEAFDSCSNLSSLTFNKGMSVIEDKAFFCCHGLAGETLTLPGFLKRATGNAFSSIHDDEITVPGTGWSGISQSPLTVRAPYAVQDTLYSGNYGEFYQTALTVEYFYVAINDLVNVVLYPEGGEFSRGLRLHAAGKLRDDGGTIVEVWKNKADWNNAISRKPTREGYVFDGFWTSASGGKQIWNADMNYVSGTGYWSTDGKWTGNVLFSMDAYAHWKPAAAPTGSWTLKYHSNNGKNDLDTQSFKVGEEKRLYYMNSRLGWEYKDEDGFNYVFMGWAKSPTGAVFYENGELVKDLAAAGKTMHVYAVWQKRAYSVCFHSNDDRNLSKTQEFRPNIAKNLLWLDSGLKWTRDGYDFLGWAKAPTSTAVVYTNGQKVNNLVAQGQTLHLYAVWRDRRWTIRYHRNYNSGDNTYEDQKIPVGASVKLLWLDSQLKWTRNGYWFKGWAKSRSAGATYQNGQVVKDLVPGGEVLHIYGAWGQKAK